MASETFTRGQVTLATWNLFFHTAWDDPRRKDPKQVPSEFEARVKKMWELEVPIPKDQRPGTGTAFEYSAYHAFELAVALTLQDLGLPSTTAARFARSNRGLLQKQFKLLSSHLKPLKKGEKLKPAFIVFRYRDIDEGNKIFRGFDQIINLNDYTEETLPEAFKTLWGHGLITLEVSGIVTRLAEYLTFAPPTRRGRQ